MTRFVLKRKLVIGTSLLAVSAFAGGAYAASTESAANSRQAFLNDVAKRLNVTPQQLSGALKGAFLDQLSAAVASGRLTQAQANEIKRHLQQGGLPPIGPGGGEGPGFEPRGFDRQGPGPGTWRGFHGKGLFHGGDDGLSAAAKYLGLSESQLLSQLQSGKSLAQIAGARGKSVSGLEDALKTAVKSQLDKAVAAKMLTSGEEQQILSRLSDALNFKINHAPPFFHPRGTFRYPAAPVAPPGSPEQVGPPPAGPVY
jgi:hypothetical protein